MMWRLIDPQHPLYDKNLAARFGDSIERVYRRCDEFVGEVLAKIDPSTPIIIVSDHGFHSFRQSVNLNTWLVQEGFMAIQGQQPGEKKLQDLFGGGTFWENVDWSRTRAYAMGLGQVYLNLKGREGHGVVSPGTDAKQVTDDLAARLMTMTDPNTHQRMVDAVYKRDDIYSGPFTMNASEIQVGLADGYRVSWQSTLGGSPPGIVYPNMKKWSGDHGSFDYKQTSGVFISSRKIDSPAPSIMDIAPTVFKYFGLPIPSDIDGKPLF
jgi:predicted AlkP superfamily phosphohydrolase/phosphomutase